MVTAGIDVGNQTIKAVVARDGSLAGYSVKYNAGDVVAVSKEALSEAAAMAGLSESDITKIVATGAGRKFVPFANDAITEITCDAKGVAALYPEARTVIDIGAEQGRAIRMDGTGKVSDFAVNEKCSAGCGAFTESMARALEIQLNEFGPLALQSTQKVPMNAQCVIFAESEVVSLIHQATPKPDIARAVTDAIAARIASMTRAVGVEQPVALIGGMSKNVGFVDSLEKSLATKLLVHQEPQILGALGAALLAQS
ncbi:MAG: CoA activase [Chloroflexota bacterium]|nr:MAG: CoA activase [Chloroflexota bacterium]